MVESTNELGKRTAKETDNQEEIKDPGQAKRRVNMPKKNEHRMHAHINPFQHMTWPTPLNPRFVDWSPHYPSFFNLPNNNDDKIVTNTKDHPITYTQENVDKPADLVPKILDIGCGYGGLCFELTKGFPDKLILGLEIRDKVVNFAAEKVNTIRINSEYKEALNIAFCRQNAMKSLHNYFEKDSVSNHSFHLHCSVHLARQDVLLLC